MPRQMDVLPSTVPSGRPDPLHLPARAVDTVTHPQDAQDPILAIREARYCRHRRRADAATNAAIQVERSLAAAIGSFRQVRDAHAPTPGIVEIFRLPTVVFMATDAACVPIPE